MVYILSSDLGGPIVQLAQTYLKRKNSFFKLSWCYCNGRQLRYIRNTAF